MTNPTPSEQALQGRRLCERADYAAAVGPFTQAAERARQAGDADTELDALDGLVACWGNLGEHDRQADAAARLLARAKQRRHDGYQMVGGMRLAEALALIDLPTRWPTIRPVLLDGLRIAQAGGQDFWAAYHMLLLGLFGQRCGGTEEAVLWLHRAQAALRPDTAYREWVQAAIFLTLAAAAQDWGDRDGALGYAEQSLAAARASDNPAVVVEALRSLADIRRWRGERDKALALAREALAGSQRMDLEPDTVRCQVLLARLLAEGGDPEAGAAYAALWAKTYRHPERYREIGALAYTPVGDLAGAEQALRLFLERRPDHPDGLSDLALVLFEQGRTQEAVAMWRAALAGRAQHPAALVGLALAHDALGEPEEARAAFRRARAMRPHVADPDYLAERFGWSTRAVACTRRLAEPAPERTGRPGAETA